MLRETPHPQGLGSRDVFSLAETEELVGQSGVMRKVCQLARKAATSRMPLLILGETGTGKELVARTIHCIGPNCTQPFVTVDCAALTPTLIESELFGYVRGAFSGAASNKTGLFGAVGAGTLLLDEIGELPIELQTRFLRVVDRHEYRPVGSSTYRPLKARIIATTNRNLRKEIFKGSFRGDLLFRLDVFSIALPPLRERRSDIPLLTASFLAELDRFSDHKKGQLLLSQDALNALLNYSWPGNVRQLRNVLHRAAMNCEGLVIDSGDLALDLEDFSLHPEVGLANNVIPLEDLKLRAIKEALTVCGGDKVRASKLLGIGKATIYRHLKDADSNRKNLQKEVAMGLPNVDHKFE